MQVILLSPFEFAFYHKAGKLACDNLGQVPVQKYVRLWTEVFPDASSMDYNQMRGYISKHLEKQLLSCRNLLPEHGFCHRGDVLHIFLEQDDGGLLLMTPDETFNLEDKKLQSRSGGMVPGDGIHSDFSQHSPEDDVRTNRYARATSKVFAVCKFLVSDSDNLKWWINQTFNQAARGLRVKSLKPARAGSVDVSEAGALAPGTHVVVPSHDFQDREDFILHHGVFVGKHFQNQDWSTGRVLHNSKESGLELVPVSTFMALDNNVYFVEYPEEGCFPVQTTLDLADILLQHKDDLPYDLFENICETIACLCKVGRYYHSIFDVFSEIQRPLLKKPWAKLLI